MMLNQPPEKKSLFTKVSLYTVSNNFVTELQIPPFTSLPKVLIWGIRTFIQHNAVPIHYNECFSYAVPENWGEILKGKI